MVIFITYLHLFRKYILTKELTLITSFNLFYYYILQKKQANYPFDKQAQNTTINMFITFNTSNNCIMTHSFV
ncbi:hypothetical protein E3149_28465 (plasmid) [Escherichia coli O157:H7]|nr:hypothetical protein E3149_28465 [Escherichia coli O157:H7]